MMGEFKSLKKPFKLALFPCQKFFHVKVFPCQSFSLSLLTERLKDGRTKGEFAVAILAATSSPFFHVKVFPCHC